MKNSGALLHQHDALLFDLDGTLALADTVIRYGPEALAAAADAHIPALIVTNNATQTPEQVAGRLQRIGIAVAAEAIVTSPQAAAAVLAREYGIPNSGENGDPARILVLGSTALAAEIARVGLLPVSHAADQPAAVVQGLSKDIGWRELAEATMAIRAGAAWIATNTDATLPTDRGQLPGNGALVAALATATGEQPRVTGKPQRALLDMAAQRVAAERPLMIGDRLETDIAAAIAADMPSLMVLTGASTIADVLATEPRLRPTYLTADLRGLLEGGSYIRLADYETSDELRSAAENIAAERAQV